MGDPLVHDDPSQALPTGAVSIRQRILEVVLYYAKLVPGVAGAVLWDLRHAKLPGPLLAVVIPEEARLTGQGMGANGHTEFTLPIRIAVILYPAENGTTDTSCDASEWAARLQRTLSPVVALACTEPAGDDFELHERLGVEAHFVNVEKPDDLGGQTLAVLGLEIVYRTDGNSPYIYGGSGGAISLLQRTET